MAVLHGMAARVSLLLNDARKHPEPDRFPVQGQEFSFGALCAVTQGC
jgi:hypothetical protein